MAILASFLLIAGFTLCGYGSIDTSETYLYGVQRGCLLTISGGLVIALAIVCFLRA